MRHRSLQAFRALGVVGCCASLTACVDSGGGDTGPQNPTAIAVAPDDFLGAVTCADAPGAARRYVVTVFDVTDPDPFALPSSGPLDCFRTASFRFVVPDHQYVARVDVYDRTDISPLGGPSSGSPVMVNAATAQFVAPRWQTACSGAAQIPAPTADGGAGCEPEPDPVAFRDTAVTAVLYLTRRVATCQPLCDRGGAAETGLSVRIDEALGGLQCGNGPGQVATFRVQRDGSSELPRSVNCGQTTTFTTDVRPGSFATFAVTAFEAAKPEPTWETQCTGMPIAGTVLPVSCDPLVPIAPVGDF